MNNQSETNFLYLNRDNRWPDFQWTGLELRANGELRLHALPRLEGEPPATLGNFSTPEGPAGIAVAADGAVYFSDPLGHWLYGVDGCDGALTPLPCLGGKGNTPAQFSTPRGLLIPQHRSALFVADSENHRVQVFDLASWQLVDIWGWRDAAGKPQPSAEPGRFDTPWALAGDPDGNVYVVDYGNGRVQKFNRAGDVVPAFWQNLQAVGLQRPVDIATAGVGEATVLYLVAQDMAGVWQVFACDPEGNPVRDTAGHPVTFGAGHLQHPMGVAASADAVYVGDNERRRVLVFKLDSFKRDGNFLLAGEVVGYHGPVAALALNGEDLLLAHTGAAVSSLPSATGRIYSAKDVLLHLTLGKAYGARGMLWSQAIKARDHEVRWHRLQAVMERLTDGAHLRLFVYTSSDPADVPAVDPAAPNPFADPRWRPRVGGPDQFLDVTDLFIGGKPAGYVWVGAHFSGGGRATPIVSQMRVEFDRETYLQHLPAIYRNDSQCGDFLARFLSLFESFFGEVETKIDDLPAWFDPHVAPREFLPWLAGWLGLELDEDWDEVMQRRIIAEAFEMYGRRGTVEGLREALRVFAGVEAIIEEPILGAAWWSLPAAETSCRCDEANLRVREETWTAAENSILGVTTMLAPAEAQGAVVGTTAILDHSHLITDEEFGVPLFEDVAHQFSVQVYRGQLRCAETLPQVRAVIEREKPAHTAYHLCIIEPRLRVGFQARVGIDTVVAGPPAAMKLGEEIVLGGDAALGGQPAGRIGEQSRVGLTTRIN